MRARTRPKFLGEQGFLLRTDRQFHWHNENYATFDAFLDALNSRHRKSIRRERRDAVANGIEIEWLTGDRITEDALDAFFQLYMETGSRKWGTPYLTREFLFAVAASMRDRILLVMAKRNGRWIAGAINFIGTDTLFGRHWGAIEHHPFLHFEVCYYQAIAFAIDRKLKQSRRRAGRAQGGRAATCPRPLIPRIISTIRLAPRHRRLSQARTQICGDVRRRAERDRAVSPERRPS